RYDIVNHVPGHVGQPEIAAAVTVGQFGVIDAQQIQNCGVQVVHMDAFVDYFPAEIVRLPVDHSALHAAAGQPHGEAVRIVVAAVVHLAAHESAAHLDHGRPAELGAALD